MPLTEVRPVQTDSEWKRGRREALALAACALTVPLRAFAQAPAKPRRVGYVNSSNLATTSAWLKSFTGELRARGWIDGQNLLLDMRFADGDATRITPLLQELLAQQPDVLVVGTDLVAKSAIALTRSVPVVFALGFDPVGLGVVKSLGRPGGNVTGISVLVYELTAKRVSVLRDAVPRLTRLGVFHHPANADAVRNLDDLKKQLHGSGIALTAVGITTAEDAGPAFERLTKARVQAVLMIPDPAYTRFRERLAELAIKHRLPSSYGNAPYVEAGALMAYAADFPDAYRRTAIHVDKILNGTAPASLPVEQANVYELVVNQKTARALGMTLPQIFLLQVTKVLE